MSTLREAFEGLVGELVAARHDDDRPRLVLADLLTENGHSLGELIQLSMGDQLTPRALELIEEYEKPLGDLVAPNAVQTWLHRGLPEIAWYRSRQLLRVSGPRFPILRQLVVEVSHKHCAEVLSHALLRQVSALHLVGTHQQLEPGQRLERLESLTLTDLVFDSAALRATLAQAPNLRRLVVCCGEANRASESLEVLSQVTPRLESLELKTPLISRAEVLDLARACGVTELSVQLHGARWSGAPNVEPKRLRVLSDELMEVGLDEQTSVVSASMLPTLPLFEAIDRAAVRSLVNDMRGWAARSSNPLFARSSFGFVDGSPTSHDEAITTDTLAKRLGRPPCAELFECLATLAVNLDQLRSHDLRPESIGVAPTRVLSCWARADPRPYTVGAVAHLSPEEVRGLEPTAPSQVYSLGLLAFRALTGRTPFKSRQRDPAEAIPGDSAQIDALSSIHHGTLFRLSELMKAPDGLSQLVNSMLELDPARRPDGLSVATRLMQFAAAFPRDETFKNVAPNAAVTLSVQGSAGYRNDERT